MKKMIFSAVALVAFSFAGMANEIEEKKVEVETIEMETVDQVKETSLEINCMAIAIDTYNSARKNGANESQAVRMMAALLVSCHSML
jgi:hypothetical protein